MQVRILFVCYENICRSPMAEGMFRHLTVVHGIEDRFDTASAGTVCYQTGSFPDPRAVRAAGRYGIDISDKRAQCIHDLDMNGFDRVFVMDHENHRDVLETLDGRNGPGVHLMTEFAADGAGHEIQDPYYGSEEGFDSTLARLARCAAGILVRLQEEYGIVLPAAGVRCRNETIQSCGHGFGR